MNRKLTVLAAVFMLGAFSAYSAPNDAEFSRYQVILARRPFGAPPVSSNTRPAPPPRPADDPFKNYRLVGLTEGDSGDISVGIVDIGSKPPASIFLTIGDSDQGIALIDADFELEGALIRKGEDQKWLYLGGNNRIGGSSGSYESVKLPAEEGKAGTTSAKGVKSYIERMRARREAAMQRKVETPKYAGKELEAHLQKYNMDLIRAAAKGESKGPPLPIQLTPEQDKQLVEEGVLPPQE